MEYLYSFQSLWLEDKTQEQRYTNIINNRDHIHCAHTS